MRTRFFALVVTTGLCGATAHASFELMLVAEQTAAGGRVVRIDPESRTNLGSFGLGKIAGTVRDIAVNRSLGRCYVLGNSLISEFNYNTGDFVQAYSVSSLFHSIDLSPTTGDVTVGGFGPSNVTPARRYSNGTFLTGVGTVFTTTTLVEYQGLQYLASSSSSSIPVIDSFAPNGTVATRAHTSTLAVGFTQSYRDMTGAAGKLWATYVDGNGDVRLRNFTISGSTLTFPADLSATFGTFGNRVSLATGHGDMIYLLNNETVNIVHAPTGTALSSFALPGITAGNARGMALIAAPEPGSLLALAGAGLAMQLGRRRRRRA